MARDKRLEEIQHTYVAQQQEEWQRRQQRHAELLKAAGVSPQDLTAVQLIQLLECVASMDSLLKDMILDCQLWRGKLIRLLQPLRSPEKGD